MATENTQIETNRDYTQIDSPYNSFLERSIVDTSNGSVAEKSVKSDGNMDDVWINNFIRSENWKPKKVGFYIDGQTGYAEFSNVYVSGDIQAVTGTIGGFVIGPDYIRDVANSFGLSSAISGGDDVRFWAGASFADRATAPFNITESGILTGTQFAFKDVAGNSVIVGGATGGASGYAIEITPTSTVQNGIRVNMNQTVSNGVVISNTSSGVGFYYSNGTNIANRGLYIQLLSSGSSNNLSAAEIENAGSGDALTVRVTGTGIGVDVFRTTGSGTAPLVKILDSIAGVGTCLLIQKTDTSVGGTMVSMENDGRGISLDITSSYASLSVPVVRINSTASSSSSPTLQLNRTGDQSVLEILQTTNSGNNNIGIRMNITNAGAGTEYAFEFAGNEYDGTKTSVSGLTGVIRVQCSDGLSYIPVYSSTA